MEPTLLPGDRLYVERSREVERQYRRGEIVVVLDPEAPTRWLIKRVHATADDLPGVGDPPVPPGTLFLTGDNASDSRDSRAFGPVPVRSVIGVVRIRYWPSTRRGAIPEA